jgi:ABC-type polysaccharide/polyol phosphate export permease
MTVRHLRGQYKQSVLGYAWALINPLSQVVILSFVFSTILKVTDPGVPFPLFLFVGLLPWIFFSSAVTTATDSIVNASSLVTKVYFPREILVTAGVFTKVFDLALGLVVLMGLMVYYGRLPEETAVWIPLVFSIHLIFTLGLSYPLAALNLYFHDVRFLVGVALTMWFYLTPVIYQLSNVPSKYHFMYDLNPNAVFIDAYRRLFLYGQVPALDKMAVGLGVAMVTFFVGYYLFKRMEPGFADSI